MYYFIFNILFFIIHKSIIRFDLMILDIQKLSNINNIFVFYQTKNQFIVILHFYNII